jgi:hypothetical protein
MTSSYLEWGSDCCRRHFSGGFCRGPAKRSGTGGNLTSIPRPYSCVCRTGSVARRISMPASMQCRLRRGKPLLRHPCLRAQRRTGARPRAAGGSDRPGRGEEGMRSEELMSRSRIDAGQQPGAGRVRGAGRAPGSGPLLTAARRSSSTIRPHAPSFRLPTVGGNMLRCRGKDAALARPRAPGRVRRVPA